MKKKFLAVAMVLVLALTAVVGGSFAYFTDTEKATNVMTVGYVDITQNEQQRAYDAEGKFDKLVDFVQGQDIEPVVGSTGAKKATTINGYEIDNTRDQSKVKNYIDKIVSVTNDGPNPAYVRTIIAIPTAGYDSGENASAEWLHWNAVSDTYSNPSENGWMWGKDHSEWPGNTQNWDKVEDVDIDGREYDLYIATNKNVLNPGESTAPSLLGFYLDSSLNYEDGRYYFMPDGPNGEKVYLTEDISDLQILVATQACQADLGADAWEALDTAFGPVAENIPFEDADRAKRVSDSEGLAAAIDNAEAGKPVIITLAPGEYTTNVKIAGGKDITIIGSGSNTVLDGQIAATSSTAGTLTLRNLTVNVSDDIKDSTNISQTKKSAIAIWGNQTVICENVTFEMSLVDSTAITAWWDTGVGTSIVCRNCTFNCAGQRPIRATGNVTVVNCTFNDPYRYAVQLTSKADTATKLDKAVINFNNNTIVDGEHGMTFVYGVQLEGETYGCHDSVINGSGNTIENGGVGSPMYYCECGKVDHDTIEWNVEVNPVHKN